jgi:signal transduction histidine kinase
MKLAPGTGTIQIEYTAMALGMPERIRYRYRLDGVDDRWQEAGRRHAAFYNNLGAGDYHFRVQASNEVGEWPLQDSPLDFSIAPTFTQTWWFKGCCGLILLAICWMAYRLHLRRVIAQMAGRLEERIDERERIARELHDTLLQSVQGLVLNVDAAAAHLPETDPARALIEAALVRAEDVLHEGRDRVRGLRNADDFRQGFVAALIAAGAQVRAPGAMPVRLVVNGKMRSLYPVVQQEALAIASEAFANAYHHAEASSIEALVVYGPREFRLSIRDNGAGISPEVLSAGGKDDHWGFLGMHERARRIKAKLTLQSKPGAGTEWAFALPGSLAYRSEPSRPWFPRQGAMRR